MLRIAAFLCIGVICTVTIDLVARALIPASGNVAATVKATQFFRYVSPDASEFTGVHRRFFAADHVAATYARGQTQSFLPAISPPSWVQPDGGPLKSSSRYFEVQATAFGWPLRSTVSEQYVDVLSFDGTERITWKRGELFLIQGETERPKVLRVRATGIVVNTLCFAGIAWSMLFAYVTFRRLRRRSLHLCESCGYVMPANRVCPECGAGGTTSTMTT
jgi:hypothetical protein